MTTRYIGESVASSLRSELADAIRPDLPMRLLRQQNTGQRLLLYVGLWGAWWSGDHNEDAPIPGAKIVVATVRASPYAEAPQSVESLGRLPWIILQFQTVQRDADGKQWESVFKVLEPDFQQNLPRDEPSHKRCRTGYRYNPAQTVHTLRSIAQPDMLRQVKIIRKERDNVRDVEARPASTPGRDCVEYSAHRVLRESLVDDSPDDVLELLPFDVFVERSVPRQSNAGQKLHREVGLVREGNLLSAIGEFKTWIVLALA